MNFGEEIMRHSWIAVMLSALLAGCTTTSSTVNLEPQHLRTVQVPNPLDHALVLATTDAFIMEVVSDHDVTVRMRFVLVAPGEQVVADETLTLGVYRRLPTRFRLQVTHPYDVAPNSVLPLSLRVRCLHQSVRDSVGFGVRVLANTITDPDQPGSPRFENVEGRVY